MKRQAKTIRKLPPESRKLAKHINNLLTTVNRINRQIDKLAEMERENQAWNKRQDSYRTRGEVDPLVIQNPMQRSILDKATKSVPF